MSARWRLALRRTATAAWIALGVVATWWSSQDAPLPPRAADQVYGKLRSMESSGKHGLLGLATLLRRLGYDVEVHRGVGAPRADVLVMLEPTVELDRTERASLMSWIRRGGVLVYAPPDDRKGKTPRLESLIRAQAKRTSTYPHARLLRVGDGMVAVVTSDVLANASLRRHGLTRELPWLRHVLHGRQHVAFDEVRLGLATAEGLWDTLFGSRYGFAAGLALAALFLWLIARGVRHQPAQVPPTPGGRALRDHFDAVGRVLRTGERHALASSLLREGTERRLGPLARSATARATFEQLDRTTRAGPTDVTRSAALLHQLEKDILTAPVRPGHKPEPWSTRA